jgi:hypothetical protein
MTSSEVATDVSPLVGYDDLAARWRPQGAGNAKALRKWVIRRCREWRLNPLPLGRGDSVRFRFCDVLRSEERAARRGGNAV